MASILARTVRLQRFSGCLGLISNVRSIQSAKFPALCASKTNPLPKNAEVEVTFIRANGERIKAKGKEGDTLLDIVVNNNIDLDGYGACEGTLTCSTCHLILKQQDYDRLPEKPSDEELDMLDLAFELCDTSRLGCQIIMTKDLDGLENPQDVCTTDSIYNCKLSGTKCGNISPVEQKKAAVKQILEYIAILFVAKTNGDVHLRLCFGDCNTSQLPDLPLFDAIHYPYNDIF